MAAYHLRVKDDIKSGGKRISAKRHANYILREDGKSHADYINREGAQSEKTDCVFKGNHLPKWAKGSAQKFFSAATRYEDKGNVRCREIELSLPNELTLEQNREIVDKFIANHVSNHYYTYAIHEKAGALSGERHPPVHIMFSERLIDDVEKTSERPACKYFRRGSCNVDRVLVYPWQSSLDSFFAFEISYFLDSSVKNEFKKLTTQVGIKLHSLTKNEVILNGSVMPLFSN